MTHGSRGPSGDHDPPWSVDLLADLHAGALDESEGARLWPRVNADPEARSVIEALETTRVDLNGLAAEPAAPMPQDVAARIDAALAEETRQRDTDSAQVVSINSARKRRNRMLGWGTGILATAAAVVAAVAIIVPSQETSGRPNLAQPAPEAGNSGDQPTMALQSNKLDAAAVGPAMGAEDYGQLGSRDQLNTCLAANDIDPDIKPAGVKSVSIDGTSAVLAILPGGKLGAFRLVLLSPECGQDNPGLIKDQTIGPN